MLREGHHELIPAARQIDGQAAHVVVGLFVLVPPEFPAGLAFAGGRVDRDHHAGGLKRIERVAERGGGHAPLPAVEDMLRVPVATRPIKRLLDDLRRPLRATGHQEHAACGIHGHARYAAVVARHLLPWGHAGRAQRHHVFGLEPVAREQFPLVGAGGNRLPAFVEPIPGFPLPAGLARRGVQEFADHPARTVRHEQRHVPGLLERIGQFKIRTGCPGRRSQPDQPDQGERKKPRKDVCSGAGAHGRESHQRGFLRANKAGRRTRGPSVLGPFNTNPLRSRTWRIRQVREITGGTRLLG